MVHVMPFLYCNIVIIIVVVVVVVVVVVKSLDGFSVSVSCIERNLK
jgi:hypothetical protein